MNQDWENYLAHRTGDNASRQQTKQSAAWQSADKQSAAWQSAAKQSAAWQSVATL